ncbi:MAG: XTP/dITP diphosphatase [Candidatus Saliniplasma sp.]
MKELNVITSNEGKFKEYKEKLSEFYEVKMLNIDYPEIQADTLEDVVEYALEDLEEYSPLITDDSGLFVEKLKGFPGVYSSYVMRTIGCEGILSLLENINTRKARFECVVGFIGEEKKLLKGTSHGYITKKKMGTRGFGYDPIFRPEGRDQTYAEMRAKEKNKISHRGRAMDELLDHLNKR